MSPGSRAWDESHSRILLAQALRTTRFGDGAKKKVRKPETKPGRDGGAKALRTEPKKYEDDARPDREPNGTGLRGPPSFSNHEFF